MIGRSLLSTRCPCGQRERPSCSWDWIWHSSVRKRRGIPTQARMNIERPARHLGVLAFAASLHACAPASSLGTTVPATALPTTAVPAAAPGNTTPAPISQGRVGPSQTELFTKPSRYRGVHIGKVFGLHPRRSKMTLPDNMQRVSALNHAEGWGFVVAVRGTDLVLLRTDDTGVVTDDLTIDRGATKYSVLIDCDNETLPSLVPIDACTGAGNSETQALSVVALRSWNPHGTLLAAVNRDVRCFCDLLQ